MEDSQRHLDVLIVGAGLSGIDAAHHVANSCPWAEFEIFESRAAIGGTWDLFRYPGVRSDSDMFTFSFPFRPWNRPEAIADGGDILTYIQETAAADGTTERIRFHTRVTDANWDSTERRWHITAERLDPSDPSEGGAPPSVLETFHLTAGFLMLCTGYYRYDRGYTPEFAGRESFEGEIIHPQFWPESYDETDRRIAVIGSGATAMTLVPSLAARADHVTMVQRSPTYVTALPRVNPVVHSIQRALGERWSGPAFRWGFAMGAQGSYFMSKRRPEAMKKALRKGVERAVPEGFDVETHFTPSYNPWDQRLCVIADGDLFRHLRDGRVSIVTDTIDRFVPEGILMSSGTLVEADTIVTATGLELLFAGGIDLRLDGESVDVGERAVYKGMMLDGVPNVAMVIGYVNASWTLKADLTCEYAARILNHMRLSGDRVALPTNTTGIDESPVLALDSGYVRRGAGLLPKQGGDVPWKAYQSYLQDYRALKRSDIVDGHLEFSK